MIQLLQIMWNQGYQPAYDPQQMYQNSLPTYSTESIDWEAVSLLDPELIRSSNDFTQLQPFLASFISTQISKTSYILNHPYAIRLCEILQLSLEYMNQTQSYLQDLVKEKDQKIQEKQRNYEKLDELYHQADQLIKIKSQNSEKCPICRKKFKTFDYLDAHIQRQHPVQSNAWLIVRSKIAPEPTKEQSQQLIEELRAQIADLQATIQRERISYENQIQILKENLKNQKNQNNNNNFDNQNNFNNNNNNNNNIYASKLKHKSKSKPEKGIRDKIEDIIEIKDNHESDELMKTEVVEEKIAMGKQKEIVARLESTLDEFEASIAIWNAEKARNQEV